MTKIFPRLISIPLHVIKYERFTENTICGKFSCIWVNLGKSKAGFKPDRAKKPALKNNTLLLRAEVRYLRKGQRYCDISHRFVKVGVLNKPTPHEKNNKHQLRPAYPGSRLQGASQRNPANQPTVGQAIGKPMAGSDDIERLPSQGPIAAAHRSKRPPFGHGCRPRRRLVQSSAKGQRVAQSHLRLTSNQQARSAVYGPCLKFFVPCK